MNQILFQLVSAPEPTGVAYSAPPDHLAGFRITRYFLWSDCVNENDRGCRQEQFQWNGVISKRTDEGLGDCWMRGNQLIWIW